MNFFRDSNYKEQLGSTAAWAGKRIGCGVHFGSRTCWHCVIDHYLLLDSYALTLYFMYCIYNNVRRLFGFHMSSNLVPCYDNFFNFSPTCTWSQFPVGLEVADSEDLSARVAQ